MSPERRRFVAIGSFGKPGGVFEVDNTLKSCTEMIDAFAPGQNVTSAGTFGTKAMAVYSSPSASASYFAGGIIALSGESALAPLNLPQLKSALKLLPSEALTRGSRPRNVKVLGGDNRSYKSVASMLREGSRQENEKSEGNDRIISAIPNPAFYGIIACAACVCIISLVGIAVVVGGSRHQDEEIAELPPGMDDGPGSQTGPTTGPAFSIPSPSTGEERERSSVNRASSGHSKAVTPIEVPSQLFQSPKSGQSVEPGSSCEEKGGGGSHEELKRGNMPVEPLNISKSNGGSSLGVQRVTSVVTGTQGKRQVVINRLTTLTKKQKSPETPGASKASWFATPKAGSTGNKSFLKRAEDHETQSETDGKHSR